MALYYNDKICVFTNEGRNNLLKQNSGIKYSLCGSVLISDYNNYLKDLYETKYETETDLNSITLKNLINNTRLLFNKVSYTYINGQYIPNNVQYKNAINDIKNHITACNISYNKSSNTSGDVNNYISYDVVLNDNSYQIINNTKDDLSFDAIAFLAMPYKNEYNDDIDIIDNQQLIVFAVEYFPTDKLLILKDQNNKLVMNSEIHLLLSDEENVSSLIPTNSNNEAAITYNSNVCGLHITNDGVTNSLNSGISAIGGTDKLFLSTSPTTENKAYDTFAKLNIMTQANTGDVTKVVPQMMFSLSRKGQKRTWDGDRLIFKYTSGNDASYFGITEVTGNRRNKLNFEFIGANNIYNTLVSGTYNNSFIYSQNNKLTTNSHNNSFINSDNNIFNQNDTNNISFINSDDNTINSGIYTSATKISFYNSDKNNFYPGVKWIKGVKGYTICNKTLINSNYNIFSGNDNSGSKSTYINTNNSRFINDSLSNSNTIIGNNYGYIKDVSGNTITIGIGLEHINASGNQIILGYYNKNSEDSNELLIVGDGRCNSAYLEKLKNTYTNWSADNSENESFFNTFSGTGNTGYDSDYYRHNIFTVNKNGYITISDYETPQNSARYGISGITSYIDGAIYDIPFNRIYNKINISDAVTEMQETIDSYTQQMTDVINTMPSNYFYTISNKIKKVYIDGTSTYTNISNVFVNIPKSDKTNAGTEWSATYTNLDDFYTALYNGTETAIPPVNTSAYCTATSIFSGLYSLNENISNNSAFDDNLILGITNAQSKDYPINIWYKNVLCKKDKTETTDSIINSASINSYCSIQLLWTRPETYDADDTIFSSTDDENIISGFTYINN